MGDLGLLIDTLIADVQLEHGLPSGHVQARGRVARATKAPRRVRKPNWTAEELDFYLENAGKLSLEDMASIMGRSVEAIKNMWFKKGLPPPTKMPGYLSTRQVALILGVDEHRPPAWVDRGILPGEKLPFFTRRAFRRVKWIHFKMWLIKPTSWVYFDVRKIKNARLRRLVELAQARWGDEWWTTRQVADYHGLLPQDIKRFLRRGALPGFRAECIGGRRQNQTWAFWFVRKTDAVKLQIKRKSDPEASWETVKWSPRADAFILRARAEGKRYVDIARMMKWPVKRVEYRAKRLEEKRRAA